MNLSIIGMISKIMAKIFLILCQTSKLTPFIKLLCDINLSKLANLKILLILTIPSAFRLLGMKKKMIPTATKRVSTLFHLSMKNIYGPYATILMISSTKNIQTKTLSKVSRRAVYWNMKKMALMKERIMKIETTSSKNQCLTICFRFSFPFINLRNFTHNYQSSNAGGSIAEFYNMIFVNCMN